MKCEDVQLLLADYIDNELDTVYCYAIEAHIKNCESCAKEVEELKVVFDDIAHVKQKQPTSALRYNFNKMLESEMNLSLKDKVAQQREVRVVMFKQWASSFWKVAAAVVILLFGMWIGNYKSRPAANGQTSDEKIASLQKDVKQMQEKMMYNLIKQESPSDRIKAVSYADNIVNPNANVINTLFGTLNNDKNANVRLAALYSLEKFSDNDGVMDSLVASLPKQTEPIIQIMLINLLTDKKETKAIGPIQDIISNNKTMKEVKDLAQKSLKSI